MSALPTRLREAEMLAYFWTMVRRDGDRIRLLGQLAGVVIARPSGWNRGEVRAEVLPAAPLECFCCKHRGRVIVWHHVIQVQHGGSSSLLNLVGLCGQCHARVHPWLPQTVRRRGWVHVRELIVPFMDWLERRFSRSA